MTRALWFVGPRQVELRETDTPAPAADQCSVRTICSGISSGTEMLAYRDELPPDLLVDEAIGSLGGRFTYPFQYGYSAVGRVEATGADVSGLAPGDVVFAFQPHQERFVAADRELVPIGELDPRHAVLLPYVETALQVGLDAGPVLEEDVVVSGLGVLGLLVAMMIGHAGARVVGVEPVAWRREAAGALGIEAIDPGRLDDLPEPALVIECSGNPAALARALEVVAHEGTVLVASWYGAKPVSLPLGGRFHRRRLTIRSTQVSTIPAAMAGRWTPRRRLERARELAGSLPLERLATHVVPFDRAGEGYARVDAAEPGVVHMAFGYG